MRPIVRALATVPLILAGAACQDHLTDSNEFAAPEVSTPRLTVAPRPESSPFGIASQQGLARYQAGPQVLNYVQDAGIGWIRMDFIWPEIEPADNQFDWSVPDSAIAWARQRGLNVYASLTYTPQWASSDSVSPNPYDRQFAVPKAHMWNRWQRFVAMAANRYPDVKYFGVWNEPNCDSFMRGRDPLNYTTLVAYAAAELHAQNRKVVVGELATYDSAFAAQHNCAPNHTQWLADAINRMSPGSVDVISIHVYDDANALVANVPAFPADLGSRVNGGWQGWPLWVTEAGPGVVLPDADAAAHLRTTMEGMLSDTSVWKKTFYWHTNGPMGILGGLDDNYTPNWGDSTAVFPRPAFFTYKDVTTGCNGCTAIYQHHNPGWPDFMDSRLESEGAQWGWQLVDRFSYWLGENQLLVAGNPDVALYRCWVSDRHYVSRDQHCDTGNTMVLAEHRMGYGLQYQQVGTVGLYQYRNPYTNERFTTIDPAEGQAKVAAGWYSQGRLAYVWP